MNMSDFFIQGFTSTTDYVIMDLIGKLPPLEEWILGDQDHATYPIGVDLNPAMEYIAKTYVEPFFPNYTKGYQYIWNKSESKTMVWHNDLVEGYNLFFLYYMNDVTDGGEIQFRVNGIETGMIQPRKHLLVMASQELHVEHKVNYTPQPRIVSNYGFNY